MDAYRVQRGKISHAKYPTPNITRRISHIKTYHKYFTIETMQIKICKFLFTLVSTLRINYENLNVYKKLKLN